MRALVGLLLALLISRAAAQRVWVVPASAPVQPVVDAAAPGDRIELYGSHPAFTVSKALDIVGMTSRAGVERIEVRGLPAGAVLAVRGLRVGNILLRGNHGAVVLRRLICHSFLGAGASAVDSARVHVESSAFAAGSFLGAGVGVEAVRSSLTMVGGGAIGFPGGRFVSTPGIRSVQSDLMLSGCAVTGGDSGVWWDPLCPCNRYTGPAEGIGGDGRLILVDGCRITGGAPGAHAYDVPEARHTPDTVLVGPARHFVVIPSQPRIDVPEQVVIGRPITARVDAEPGAAVVLFADIVTVRPTAVPGVPVPFYLTPDAHVAGVRIADPQGVARFQVGVPDDRRLRYRTVFVQAVAGTLAPPRVGASVPRSVHID